MKKRYKKRKVYAPQCLVYGGWAIVGKSVPPAYRWSRRDAIRLMESFEEIVEDLHIVRAELHLLPTSKI